MKRIGAIGSVIMIILVSAVWMLSHSAIDPQNFTGCWYGAENGDMYLFHEGMITREGDNGSISGAYVFSKDRIVLFLASPEGESTVRELYLAGEPKGEFLSESPEGNGRIVFARKNIAVQSHIQSEKIS